MVWGKLIPGFHPLRKKETKKFVQDGYFCEECNEVFDDETIYDKQRKMFLCQQCKSQTK